MFILKNSFGSLVDRDIADKPYSQNTPFITPTKYTVLLNTDIKCASQHVSVQVYHLQGEQNANFKTYCHLQDTAQLHNRELKV